MQASRRLAVIARASGISLDGLPLQMITDPKIRLDVPRDQEAIEAAVRDVRPRLLVLDPFVRLHSGVSENSVHAVAPILDFLKVLQLTYGVAVIMVHHSRKGGASKRAGQRLRGSSDFHAWGDSNLYLERRSATEVMLSTEHRAAASEDGIRLTLREDGKTGWLVWGDGIESPTAPRAKRVAGPEVEAKSRPPSAEERVLAALAAKGLSMTELRKVCKLRQEKVQKAADALVAAKRVVKRYGKVEVVK